MSNILKKASSITEIDNCFILKDEQHRLHSSTEKSNLPVIDRKYEDVLEKLQIPYRVIILAQSKKGCEYWDKEKYETKQVTLPEYVFVLGQYTYIGNYTGDIPTEETLEAAYKLKSLVDEELKQIKKNEKVDLIKEILSDRNCAYVNRFDFKGNLEEGEVKTENGDHYYVFVIKRIDGTPTTHILIFDANRIYKEKVELKLEKKIIPYIIGKDGCNFKRIRNAMKIKFIQVIEVE